MSSLSQRRARNQSDDALSARARFVLPVSLFVEESLGNINFRVAFDTLNIKSSKKYEPFAPSATHTASKREEEL